MAEGPFPVTVTGQSQRPLAELAFKEYGDIPIIMVSVSIEGNL